MAKSVTPSKYGNVTIGGSKNGLSVSTVSITNPGTGYSATPSSVLTMTNGTTGASWTASNSAKMTARGQLKVEGEDADILINELSLSDWMQAVNRRLSILQVKPELHEKYSALQEAYDHYKTLEALLYDDPTLPIK